MRKTLSSVLQLFRELRDLQNDLEKEMKECLQTFYGLGRKKALCARGHRRPGGDVRAIYLAARCKKSFVYVKGRKIRLHLHIKNGPINDGIIRKIAHDMENATAWRSADADRRELNRRSASYAFALRDLRLALANKFASRATEADRALAYRVMAEHPYLTRQDNDAVLGASTYDRLLQGLERDISQTVLRWKEAMKDVPFEPMVRWRSTGPLRVSWAYVDRFYDSRGDIQVRSHDIPGGVSDRWLRKNSLAGGASRRKEILGYAVTLRRLTGDYSRLLVYVGRLKARVRRALFQGVSGGRPVAGAEAI